MEEDRRKPTRRQRSRPKAKFTAIRNKARRPSYPGALLANDIVPALGKTKTEIVRLLGISRQSFYDILNEAHPVTPQMAVRLGKLCGNGPGLWLRMQSTHDL